MSKQKNPPIFQDPDFDVVSGISSLTNQEFAKVQNYLKRIIDKKNKPIPKRVKPGLKNKIDKVKKEMKSKSKKPTLPKTQEDILIIKNQVTKNKFFELGVHNQHKEDVAIDKKLSAGNKLTPKGTRVTTIDVACQSCGKKFTTSPQFVYKDPDGNVHFTCDRCIVRAHKSK